MGHTSIYRKDSVVITTIDIISELGMQGLTSKEIAKREKISEGTLFSHFKNMNEIILEVLNYHSQLDTSIIETVESKNLSPIGAIKLFASICTENYENYPQSTALINISERLLQREELAEKADQITDNKIVYLKSLVEKAIKSENINPVVDSEFLTNLMVGYFRVIVQQWRKSEYEFKFKERVLNDLQTSLSFFAK